MDLSSPQIEASSFHFSSEQGADLDGVGVDAANLIDDVKD